jgi:hypothetical protein
MERTTHRLLDAPMVVPVWPTAAAGRVATRGTGTPERLHREASLRVLESRHRGRRLRPKGSIRDSATERRDSMMSAAAHRAPRARRSARRLRGCPTVRRRKVSASSRGAWPSANYRFVLGSSGFGDIHTRAVAGSIPAAPIVITKAMPCPINGLCCPNILRVDDGEAASGKLLDLPAPAHTRLWRNDLLAIGLLRAALTQGLSVRNDVAIVGYEDVVFAELASVPLTPARQPIYELGLNAAKLPLDEVAKAPKQQARATDLQARELVVRQSTVGRARCCRNQRRRCTACCFRIAELARSANRSSRQRWLRCPTSLWD